MSKLNERCIDTIQDLIHYVDESHTEYSVKDCIKRGDVRDLADDLLNDLRIQVINTSQPNPDDSIWDETEVIDEQAE